MQKYILLFKKKKLFHNINAKMLFIKKKLKEKGARGSEEWQE